MNNALSMDQAPHEEASVDWTDKELTELRERLNTALRGKPEVIEHVLACLLAKGHLLIEDLPGLGKTTLAKALAHAIGGRFARVQCTPDLLPGDITGFSIFNQKTREFEFMSGLVFADILLADEINRTTPRTQSALLEAMGERQVTVDNTRYPLSKTFFVIATQNPMEHHGTYPLPEAQLDRFAMKLTIGYAEPEHEITMLQAAANAESDAQPTGQPVITLGQLARIQEAVAAVHVDRRIQEYIIAIAHATRRHPRVQMGMSPRGMLILQRLAQAYAFMDEREYVTPDDVQKVASPVLDVRLAIESEGRVGVIEEILRETRVPDYR